MKKCLKEIIENWQRKKIMVIGDIIADVYLEGRISRISREAPVLVLEHMDEKVIPGGAANAIYNAGTLGGDVYAVGIIGDDQAGKDLIATLEAKDIHTDGLIIDRSRPTITKTRIMAGGQATVRQQIVRVDREKKTPPGSEVANSILSYISANLPSMNAVVMSDYGSQAISTTVRQMVVNQCKEYGIPCMVDSRYNILEFQGVTFVKQNEAETGAAVGFEISDRDSLYQAGSILLEKLEAEGVLITRGAEGMSIFEQGGRVTHIPVSNVSEVFDVTGAGDTVVVAMMLGIAAGASSHDAARIANFAAGIVVKKPGTATVTPEELQEAIRNYGKTDTKS